jgi:hypothetical protein
MKPSRSVYVKAAAVALAIAAAGAAPLAQARSNVFFSVGANVAPGVSIGVSNGPVYYPQPVYYPPVAYYPQPVYVQPAPVYYGGGPVYYGAPVVSAYYGPGYWRHHRHHRGFR